MCLVLSRWRWALCHLEGSPIPHTVQVWVMPSDWMKPENGRLGKEGGGTNDRVQESPLKTLCAGTGAKRWEWDHIALNQERCGFP